MKTNAQRQAAYRARYNKRGEALKAILAKLEGRTTALSNEVRLIAQTGLETVEGGMS